MVLQGFLSGGGKRYEKINEYCLILFLPRDRRPNRQDLVFVSKPDAGKDFRVSINPVWSCRVLLLFYFYTSTDSGFKRHDCAFVSVLSEYD